MYTFQCICCCSATNLCLTVTPWTAACQASLSFTISWGLLRLMSTELVIPSDHLILCCPLLLLPSIFPTIRVFCNELAMCTYCTSKKKDFLKSCQIILTGLKFVLCDLLVMTLNMSLHTSSL